MERRRFLQSAAATGLWSAAGWPGLAFADAATDRRLALVILRGGMDGLAAFPPFGDPALAGLRAPLLPPAPGKADGALGLDSLFALHPALAPLHAFWQRGEMALLPAIAIARRTRSHFDAQDVLENGSAAPHGAADGWLNRALALLPPGAARRGMSLGYAVAPVMRGATPVASWSPARLPHTPDSLFDRVAALYAGDALLGPALAEGRRAAGLSRAALGGMETKGRGSPRAPRQFNLMAEAAGRFLAAPDGPRIAALEMGGWDTHAHQGAGEGQLARNLALLAGGLVALAEALGPAWQHTAIVCVTEFGRTARINGTGGTDHGTAGAAFLLGGAVAGGQVVGRWPGLGGARLFEGRDLAPALDTRALFRAVLEQHLALTRTTLDRRVFPGAAGLNAPAARLIRS